MNYELQMFQLDLEKEEPEIKRCIIWSSIKAREFQKRKEKKKKNLLLIDYGKVSE